MQAPLTDMDLIRYEKTLERAAFHNSFGKYKIIARLHRGRQFIGQGGNYYPNRRDGSTYHADYAGVGVHAELDCVSRYPTRRGTLYVAGLSRMGFEIISRPCPRCSRLLANTDLSWVVFNSEDGIIKVTPDELLS